MLFCAVFSARRLWHLFNAEKHVHCSKCQMNIAVSAALRRCIKVPCIMLCWQRLFCFLPDYISVHCKYKLLIVSSLDILITSAKENLSVFIVVCLSVCWQLCANTSERICMKFSGKVGNWPLNKRLNYGGDPNTDWDTNPDPYHTTGKTWRYALFQCF